MGLKLKLTIGHFGPSEGRQGAAAAPASRRSQVRERGNPRRLGSRILRCRHLGQARIGAGITLQPTGRRRSFSVTAPARGRRQRPAPGGGGETLAMSGSTTAVSSPNASEPLGRNGSCHAPEEWPATRAEPALSQDEMEGSATRIQARQPNGIDEWRVPQQPAGGTPQMAAPLGRFGASARSPSAWAATRAQTALATQLLEDETECLATERKRSAARSAAIDASSSSPALRPRRCSSPSSTCSPTSSRSTTSLPRRRASSSPASPRRAGGRCRSWSCGARGTARRWRRWSCSSCRPPTTSCCASTRPKPMPTRRRATQSPASCSPTAGSASSWSASCRATRSRRR